MEQSNGYDFVCVLKEEEEKYKCPICLALMKNTMELPCAHAICKVCLDTCWRDDVVPVMSIVVYKCPLCSRPYRKGQVHASGLTDRIIRTTLTVKCIDHKEGCSWQGKICDYYGGHEKKCLYKSTECTLCLKTMQRMKLAEHKLTCTHRLIPCKYCEEMERFIDIKKHYQGCISYPMLCLNDGCNIRFARNKIDAHKNECLFQELECDFKDVGCKRMIIRKNIKSHLDECLHEHMKMLLISHKVDKAELVETRMKLQSTKTMYAALKLELQQANSKVNHLQVRLDNATETIEKMSEINSLNCTSFTDDLANLHKKIDEMAYQKQFQKLFKGLEPFNLIRHEEDDGYYLKINVEEYINSDFYIQMHTTDRRSMYKDKKKTVFYNDDFCLRLHGGIYLNLFFFLDGWYNFNTKAIVMHPEHHQQCEDFCARSFHKTLTPDIVTNGHILVKLERKTVIDWIETE